ncbi:hypothetical protein A4R35_09880 [Thermogemmatispora tikiterensis]|uniref:Peptidase S9 prolyl oligopeptidase catalytic domain-containing protein n=1 Tax=Thermogemmatispora tikiterensis TaxID=1825093 RepID=A0A328VNV1_9CHLR|nr:hypothetical protein A4R35_09880 [Thermogemmatispora tikiterensis]
MGSAQAPEVEALVADGAFATQWSAVGWAVPRTLRFSAHLLAWVLRLLCWVTDQILCRCTVYCFQQVEPVRTIGRIAPRPILLIHGGNDTIVDPDDAMRLYQAAHAPKELWLIPPHGAYSRVFYRQQSLYQQSPRLLRQSAQAGAIGPA